MTTATIERTRRDAQLDQVRDERFLRALGRRGRVAHRGDGRRAHQPRSKPRQRLPAAGFGRHGRRRSRAEPGSDSGAALASGVAADCAPRRRCAGGRGGRRLRDRAVAASRRRSVQLRFDGADVRLDAPASPKPSTSRIPSPPICTCVCSLRSSSSSSSRLMSALTSVDVALQPAEQVPERACGLRQLLGAEHDQRHDGDDDDFGKADVEHGAARASAIARRAFGANVRPVRASPACGQALLTSSPS